ncbi:hypothetical protein KR009_000107 [Drosophila setifemur]|nr:hypothetical protein KR009_000107 [Drosophila setifemur]
MQTPWFHVLFLLAGGASRAEEPLLELACSSDAQCTQFDRGHCVDSSCFCTARGSGERVDCSPRELKLTNIIGGPCPCAQPNAECDARRDQCVCSLRHVPSEDRRRCVPEVVPLDGKCEFSRQCQLEDRFSFCNSVKNRCICRTNFEEHKGRCLAVLEASCKVNTDCGSCAASLCFPQLKKCGCAEAYVHNRNMTKCITGAALGDVCDHSPQCQVTLGAAGQCQDHRCACRPTHYPKRVAHIIPNQVHEEEEEEPHPREEVICEPVILYGAYCRHDGDCRMQHLRESSPPALNPMVCLWGECRCSEHHRLQENQCLYVESGVATPSAQGLLLGFVFSLQFTMILY